MYGILSCPRCGTVQGADLSHSRVGCVRCQHGILVSRAVVHFSTDSPTELAAAVRHYTDIVRGCQTPSPQGIGTNRGGRSIWTLMEELGEGVEEFTSKDLATQLEVDEGEAEKLILELLTEGVLFESGPGTYRLV